MTVLHIQKFRGISGSENHLLDLLPGLNASEPCEFLALEEPGYPQQEYLKRFEDRGIRTHRMVLPRAFSVQTVFALARFIREHRFQLVHTHLIHADIHGAFAAKLAGVPCVSSKHGWDIYERLTWSQQTLLKIASRIPEKVICISHALVPYVQSFEGVEVQRIQVIHYGLNPPQQEIPEPDGLFDLRELRLLFIGRLVKEKGVYELLEAISQLRANGLPVHLSMAGVGPLQVDLQTQIQSLKLSDCVSLMGFCENILVELRRHHALVLPTYGEGFGLVCLEAMAAKRAVFASHVTALPEIVSEGVTGVLFQARSAAALVAAITPYVQQLQRLKAMGLAGFERLCSEFGRGRMIEQTAAVYREVLQKKS